MLSVSSCKPCKGTLRLSISSSEKLLCSYFLIIPFLLFVPLCSLKKPSLFSHKLAALIFYIDIVCRNRIYMGETAWLSNSLGYPLQTTAPRERSCLHSPNITVPTVGEPATVNMSKEITSVPHLNTLKPLETSHLHYTPIPVTSPAQQLMFSRPLVLPDPFSAEGSSTLWQFWIESMKLSTTGTIA